MLASPSRLLVVSLLLVSAALPTVARAQAAPDPVAPKVDPEHPFPQHIKSPSLDGGVQWLNTAGPLDIKDLRGKFVILDFWTYCCINCMHILPELKKLEHKYPRDLVVIGVHSAKFFGEKDTENIRKAILRYEIEHPVVNDADHKIWDAFQVQSWPSLRVVDPEGNLVAGHSGEVDFETLDGFIKRALPYYKKKGVLDESPLQFDQEKYSNAARTPLRFPGKVLTDEAGGRLFIADSNHNRIVIATLDGKLQDVIGTGEIGSLNGAYDKATFDHPQGMVLHEDQLYVADTENHMLRRVDLKTKEVSTIAGTGVQRRGPWPGLIALPNGQYKVPEKYVDKPRKTALNSPWALWIHDRFLYIAMAGPHQIWRMPLTGAEIGPWAGNGREDIVDGLHLPRKPYQTDTPEGETYASFAQPSGLSSDGKLLYVADSEGSSIRAVPFDAKEPVTTVVGTAHFPHSRLFLFGDADGINTAGNRDMTAVDAGRKLRLEQDMKTQTVKITVDGKVYEADSPRDLVAKHPAIAELANKYPHTLQHPLGVNYLDGKLYVADTYNNKIKVIDIAKQTCQTLVGTGAEGHRDDPAEFDEPAGLAHAGGKLYVADTNNHLIRVVDLKTHKVSTLTIAGLEPPKLQRKPQGAFAEARPIESKPAMVTPKDGKIQLAIDLKLPEGFKINPAAPMRYKIEVVGESGAVDRAAVGKSVRVTPPSAQVKISLPASGTGSEKLKLSLVYFYCKEGAEGVCKVGSVEFRVPLVVAANAASNSVSLTHTVE